MGFLAAAAPIVGAVGSLLGGAGKNTAQVGPATGNAQFTNQNLQPAINQGQTGFGTAESQIGNVFANQGTLAQQLAAQAQGQGPNIAQLQLQQATNRNIAQGAGLIGSQRGMNPALAARLIAQQTAAANQEAAGQSGLMRAQQQLAAQGALANVYGQQGNLATAGGQLANQNLSINQQALSNQNQQIVGANEKAQTINAEAAQKNADVSGKLIGGLTSGLSGALAAGSTPSTPSVDTSASINSGGGTGMISGNNYNQSPSDFFGLNKAHGGMIRGYNEGGDSEETDEAGKTIAKSIPKSAAEAMANAFKAHGGMMHDYRVGGHVPGKAKHPGDDERNDVVPAMLSKGEVVLPNSVTKAENAPDKAKEFMQAIMEQRKPGPKGFSKILAAKQKMKEAMDHMDAVHKMLHKAV